MSKLLRIYGKYVGIGTASPNTNLHVAATNEDVILRLTPFTAAILSDCPVN